MKHMLGQKTAALKALGFSAFAFIAQLLTHPIMTVAHAGDIEFNVGDDGELTISGGNFPDLSGDADISTSFNDILGKYKTVAIFIFAACTITAFLLMVFMFTKLAAAGDNEQARRKAIAGILTCGIAVALLGGITIVISFFWNSLSVTEPASGS